MLKLKHIFTFFVYHLVICTNMVARVICLKKYNINNSKENFANENNLSICNCQLKNPSVSIKNLFMNKKSL